MGGEVSRHAICPLEIFTACILCKVKDVTRFADVKQLTWHHLDAWDAKKIVGLVKGIEEEALICDFGASHGKEFEIECAG